GGRECVRGSGSEVCFKGWIFCRGPCNRTRTKKRQDEAAPVVLALPHLREWQDAQSRTRRKQCQNLARLALQPIFEFGAIVESEQRLVPPESLVKVTIGSGPK